MKDIITLYIAVKRNMMATALETRFGYYFYSFVPYLLTQKIPTDRLVVTEEAALVIDLKE